MEDTILQEIQVKLSDVIDWMIAVQNKQIDYDWQRNKQAYYQYMYEVQMWQTFQPEDWFLDEGRREHGWPQMIIEDYCRYHRLAKAADVDAQTNRDIVAMLEELRQTVAAQAAALAQLKEGHRSADDLTAPETEASEPGEGA